MGQRAKKPIGRRSSGEGRKTFWTLFAAAAVACAMGLFHTWTRIAVLDRSYRLGKARQESADLNHELEALRLEVATLQAAGRVDKEAQEKLGLRRPAPDRMIVLENKGETAQVSAKPGVKDGSLAVK